MTISKQIVSLAETASQLEAKPADAAALLLDAAAMLSVEANMPAGEASKRFTQSYNTLATALEVVNTHGSVATQLQ